MGGCLPVPSQATHCLTAWLALYNLVHNEGASGSGNEIIQAIFETFPMDARYCRHFNDLPLAGPVSRQPAPGRAGAGGGGFRNHGEYAKQYLRSGRSIVGAQPRVALRATHGRAVLAQSLQPGRTALHDARHRRLAALRDRWHGYSSADLGLFGEYFGDARRKFLET